MTGAFAHGAIFFIRDYNPEQNEDNVLARMLDHKEAIISHLSWASLFLGFHTLGLYVHNDVMLAFGTGYSRPAVCQSTACVRFACLHPSSECLVLFEHCFQCFYRFYHWPGRPLLSINGHRTLTPYSPSFLGSRHHNRSSVPPSRNQNLTRNRQSQLEDHKTWERE
ncbi:UNVERIFIED_CONTAM: Photosystem I chlorophyll a apoprotein A2 [Sesamum angustifolium]|uniref:Photosystem I chlorophyll a apoprotein A2 n=1 Tax=Sesamum angustifolium TaxID=2727405 RepID=A0AAW2JZS7_9LAMI